MKQNIVRITTADTKKTYEFPREDNPDLWQATLVLWPVNKGGDVYTASGYTSHKVTIYLEQDTLLKAGLKPYSYKEKETDPEPQETTEDLLIRLLEHLGYYPTE